MHPQSCQWMSQCIHCHLFSLSNHCAFQTMLRNVLQRPHTYFNDCTVQATPDGLSVSLVHQLFALHTHSKMLRPAGVIANAAPAHHWCLPWYNMKPREVVWPPPLVNCQVYTPPITHRQIRQVADTLTIGLI